MSDAYGVRINNINRQRQIDGRKIVPQLIATYNMGAYPYVESVVNSGAAQDGFICRIYQFPYDPNVFNRPVVVFHSLQNDGQEVYVAGAARLMYRPSAAVAHPTMYVYALDYVTSSGSAWGRRVFNGNNQIMYDSGNNHLNVQQIISGVNLNNSFNNVGGQAAAIKTGHASPLGGFPQYPMICVDHFEHYFYSSNKFSISETRSSIFYRPYYGAMEAVMLSYDRKYDVGQNTPAPKTYIHTPNPNGRTIMVIDQAMY
jgi:hypothetical protein